MDSAPRGKAAILFAVVLACSSNAAYPTPGEQARQMQTHPLLTVDPREVIETFTASHPGEDFTMVVDEATGSLIVIARMAIHDRLHRYIDMRSRERLRELWERQPPVQAGVSPPAEKKDRYMIEVQVLKTVQGRTQIVGEPRLEVGPDQSGSVSLDGVWAPGGPEWTSGVAFRPRRAQDGTLHLSLEGFHAASGETRNVEVPLQLDTEVLITSEEAVSAVSQELEELARFLNKGRGETSFSLSLKVQPL
jgi:hypothetical protein